MKEVLNPVAHMIASTWKISPLINSIPVEVKERIGDVMTETLSAVKQAR